MIIPASQKKQRGVVIILALVMLLGMTVLSVTSMTNSTLEERMSANQRDREVALQAAEAALRYGERLAPTISQGSFTTTCDNGWCNYELQGVGPFPVYWTDATLDVWNDDNTPLRHIVYNITFAEVAAQPKLIIEWMGVQEQNEGGAVPGDPSIFRITALGTGLTPQSRVMLQSTFIP